MDEAERHLDDVEPDPPDRARYPAMRALVSNGRWNWPEPERRWQAVIDAFPNCGDACTGRATAIRMQARMLVAELVPILDEALDRHLDDERQPPLVHWSKGKAALADGDLVRAVRSLRIARTAAIDDPAIRAELDMAEARLAAVGLAGARAPFGPHLPLGTG